MTSIYTDLRARMSAPKPGFAAQIEQLTELQITPELPLSEFFAATREVILQSAHFKQLLEEDPLLQATPAALLAEINRDFYASLEPETGYATCIGNPDHAVSLYGADLGRLTAAIYTRARALRQYLLQDDYLNATQLLKLFFDLHARALAGDTVYESWLGEWREYEMSYTADRMAYQMLQRFSPEADYFRRVLETADLTDTRYLYRYGIHLSEHDFAMAEFMTQYSEDELADIARFILRGWVDGFTRARKDYTKKRYANLMIPCGMERLGKMLLVEIAALGLEALVPLPHTNGINRQFAYDHRFDGALILDRHYVETALENGAKTMEAAKDLIALQAGPVYVELFGETPFSPAAKDSALKFSPEQQSLAREQSARYGQLYYQYYKRDEASFTIIAFPSPEIGPRFEEIFADTLRINLLDSDTYARIQQNIIDVLDTAEFVHVKGKSGNDTDIRVRMHPLSDPATQTNFENCVADVNIPVGEVFTSPLLTGTTGMLHVEDIYLGSLRYYNLRMSFEDGWVKDYSCSNFADPAEGKKYIHENLLLPHETLPIGEFAIGTNTLAYQIARKYDIQALLPILIIEKMGPHFAIGDTCFSHEEDAPHPSFVNGKEMVAVENEKSATRKEDPVNAYTMKHMDITLPYDMLESITAIAADGSTAEIIRDGRFVVPGTEELNIPLDEMEA